MNPIFETERLVVRPWDPDRDAEAGFEMYGNPNVVRFLGGTTQESVETLREALRKGNARYAELADGTGYWALERKGDGVIVGAVLLKKTPSGRFYEVGWHLAEAHWGHGYATEAARAALQYGFETLGLDRIVAIAFAENEKSLAVMRRLGMTYEGKVVEYDHELEMYAIQNPSQSLPNSQPGKLAPSQAD